MMLIVCVIFQNCLDFGARFAGRICLGEIIEHQLADTENFRLDLARKGCEGWLVIDHSQHGKFTARVLDYLLAR